MPHKTCGTHDNGSSSPLSLTPRSQNYFRVSTYRMTRWWSHRRKHPICQFSPFTSKMGHIGWIGSGAPKRPRGFLFFQLLWVPNLHFSWNPLLSGGPHFSCIIRNSFLATVSTSRIQNTDTVTLIAAAILFRPTMSGVVTLTCLNSSASATVY